MTDLGKDRQDAVDDICSDSAWSPDQLGSALWKLFQTTDQNEYIEIIRQNPELLSEEIDRRLVVGISKLDTLEEEQVDAILEELKYHRRVLRRCRRRGVDQAFRPISTLEMMYDFAGFVPHRVRLVDELPENIRNQLDDLFSLRDLLQMSLRYPIVNFLLRELDMDNLRNMIILTALIQLAQAESLEDVKEIILQNPELLDDDALMLLDVIIGDENERMRLQFAGKKKLLLRCREVGVDAAIEEETIPASVARMTVPENVLSALEAGDPAPVIEQLQRFTEENPDWLNELGQNNPFFAAAFALLGEGNLLTPAELIKIISERPLMLTKQFDEVFLKGHSTLSLATPPAGISTEFQQAYLDAIMQQLDIIRRLRGLGLESEHLARLSACISGNISPDDVLAHFDFTCFEDYVIVSGIGLIESPLPLLACRVMDGHIGLEQATRSVVERDVLVQLDERTIERQDVFIKSFLATDTQNKFPGYVLAELNFAVACAKGTERMVAETSGTLRESISALMSHRQAPEERSRLIERRLSVAHKAVDAWRTLEDENRYANALVGLGAAYFSLPYGNRSDNCLKAIECLQEAHALVGEFASPQENAKICSDPLELDNYASSSRISPRKGKVQCQSVERLHRNSRPRLSWKN